MSKPIRVIQYGLGAIGRATARLVLSRPQFQLVGAVDRDPSLSGRELADVLGLRKKTGLRVTGEAALLFGQVRADAVIHCTTSRFVDAYEQFAEIARAGLHCVTSCEEALFPYHRHAPLADRLDTLLIKRAVALVGTGVNPGFVMDTLALVLTAVCQRVERIRVLRVVNAATRREALQCKVGASLVPEAFAALANQDRMGHVGLAESLVFLSDALGWPLDRVDESLAPVIATKRERTPYLTVNKGAVAGIHQFAHGYRGRREVLTLELQMYVGAKQPQDVIEIEGEPPLRVVIDRGVPGDIATPAILVNMLPRVVEAVPGLHTMRTLGLPRIVGSAAHAVAPTIARTLR